MYYLQKGKANVIIDGQWGSTGKGKLAGYIAKRSDIEVAVCDFQTNAGHTWVSDGGKSVMVQQIPSSFINEKCQVCINAASTIKLKTLLREIEEHNLSGRLYIHPHAGIITGEDVDKEAGGQMQKISSTQKGCGAALSRKIRREAKLAQDFEELTPFMADTSEIVQDTLFSGGTVLIETAQGFDLSLNHGTKYPYTTSRDITIGSALSNAGVSPIFLGNVYGSLRSFPIRVGNVYDKDGNRIGWSGPKYPDQEELTWDQITTLSGSDKQLSEITTVTKKLRRIFTWSQKQLFRFIAFNMPTYLFINFVNYIDWDNKGKREYSELSSRTRRWVENTQKDINEFCSRRHVKAPKISLLGTGEFDSDMIEV